MDSTPHASPADNGVDFLFYCRAGFENECACEAIAHFRKQGLAATVVEAEANSGYALVRALPQARLMPLKALIFARQALQALALHVVENDKDRLTPLVAKLKQSERRYADVWVETADTAEGKALLPLCRGVESAAVALFKKEGLITSHSPLRLHIFFIDRRRWCLAFSRVESASPHRMGIMRLKQDHRAPSRSALKLTEAHLTLLSTQERETALRPDFTAVDLGAAPGGWSWVLAQHSIKTIAVDNAALRREVLDTGLVNHVRADGFVYRPLRKVHWVVCDMVERPARIANLMTKWLVRGDAQAALFNLKLPMKKRWAETETCLSRFSAALESAKPSHWRIRAKQLYHDREEITVLALPRAFARADGKLRRGVLK